MEFFPYLLFGTDFFFDTHVSRLKIEAPSLSTVQGKCIYKIGKAENQKNQFPLFYNKPSIDKYTFSSFQSW